METLGGHEERLHWLQRVSKASRVCQARISELTRNSKGEKITVKAHGGSIDIEGVTVAEVDDHVRVQKLETWFDPLEMFRQMAPDGIINKEIIEYNTEVVDENEVKNSEATVTSSGGSVNRDVSGQAVEPVKAMPSSLTPAQDQDRVTSPGAMSIDERKSPSFEKEKQSDETSPLGSIVEGAQAALSVGSDKSFENVGAKDIDHNYDPKDFSDIELEVSLSIFQHAVRASPHFLDKRRPV